jgi:thymidylate synthase (FAD)
MHRAVNCDAERLVEFAGRVCYKSWEPGLNPNVTKVRGDSEEYLRNIITSRHGSVLEHAQFTFLFTNVSRVLTHELVRHRAGVAISQESLRYVRLTDLSLHMPDAFMRNWNSRYDPIESGRTFGDVVIELVEKMEEFQVNAARHFGLDNEGVPFHIKKEVTSALRRLAPMGMNTTIVWSANLRTLRWVTYMRTQEGAEEEIRRLFILVGRQMKECCPVLFEDFREENGSWVTECGKV